MGWVQEGVTILIRGGLGQRRLPVRLPGSADADQASVDYDVGEVLCVLQSRAVDNDACIYILPQSDQQFASKCHDDLLALS